MREIIATAKTIVDEKNADELFQQFVWHTRDVDWESKRPVGEVPVTKEQARSEGQEGQFPPLFPVPQKVTWEQPYSTFEPSSPSSLRIPKSANSFQILRLSAAIS
jgi:hypothetical protein